jgi:hypothetical protein
MFFHNLPQGRPWLWLTWVIGSETSGFHQGRKDNAERHIVRVNVSFHNILGFGF